jgi:hypothetical protein
MIGKKAYKKQDIIKASLGEILEKTNGNINSPAVLIKNLPPMIPIYLN